MALVAQSCNTLRTAAVAAALLALTACGAAAQPPGEVPDDRDSAEAVAAGTWHQVPVSPAGSLLGPVLTWDGHELLQIGGTAGEIKGADGATVDGPALTDTVAFSPASGRWRRLDPAPFPVAAQRAPGPADSCSCSLRTARRCSHRPPGVGARSHRRR